MIFTLAACGGKDKPQDNTDAEKKTVEEKEKDDKGDAEKSKVEIYDTGIVSVEVPEGWTAGTYYALNPDEKAEDELDEEIDKESITIYKGEPYGDAPNVTMILFDDESGYEEPTAEDLFMEDITDRDDLKLGDNTFGVFEEKSGNTAAVFTRNEKGDNFLGLLLLKGFNDDEISLDDPDVQQIIGSFKRSN